MRTTTVLVMLALSTACGSSTARTESASSEGSTEAAPTSTLTVGSPAPEFMLQDQTGRVRTLAEYRGHPVVLYFYPRDATPGCTREACAFRDAWTRLEAAGAVVLGVSTDDVISHQHFHDAEGLPFDLLADTEATAANAYGVPVRMGGFASRQTFLIDAQGNVAQIWPDVDPAVHAEEVIAAIAALPPATP